MKITIVAVMSADGFIARSTTELADWSAKEDKKLFVEVTKRAGVIVMGSTTYKTIGRALPGRRNIVYSHTTIDQPGIETTQESPQALVERLTAEGCTELTVCGGKAIYDMFLQADLVDELYLTYAPLLFGSGIGLAAHPLTTKLKLLECKQLNSDTVLLHYATVHNQAD